jgi:hypothetical protein
LSLSLPRFTESEALFQELISILSRDEGIHPDTAIAFGNMAIMHRKAQQLPKAILAHERAVKITGTILGQNHVESLYQRGQYGITLLRSNQEEERARGSAMVNEAISQMTKLGFDSSHLWVKMLQDELKNASLRDLM